MSSSSFPLLQLPFVPMKMITDYLSLDKLISISRDQMFFKMAGIKPEDFNLTLDSFGWSIKTSKTNRDVASSTEETKKAEDMFRTLAKVQKIFPGSIDVFTTCPTVVKDLNTLSQLPEDVNVFVFNSTHDAQGREFAKEDPTHPSWSWPAETYEVEREREARRQEEKKDIENLLIRVGINDGLVVSGPGRAIVSVERYNEEYVRDDYSGWINMEIFLSLENRVVYLNRTHISEKALNLFFHWFQEDKVSEELEILTIKRYVQDAPWNRRALMNGLGARRETNFKLHLPNPSKSIVEKFYPVTMEQLEQGIDLSGADSFDRVDGRTCSIVVNKHEVVMYVYNQQQ